MSGENREGDAECVRVSERASKPSEYAVLIMNRQKRERKKQGKTLIEKEQIHLV